MSFILSFQFQIPSIFTYNLKLLLKMKILPSWNDFLMRHVLNELNKLVNYPDKMSLSIGGVYDKGFMGWSWLLFWCFDFAVSFIAFQNLRRKMQLPKVRGTAQILILHKYIYIFNDRVFTLFNNELMKFLLMCCDRSL